MKLAILRLTQQKSKTINDNEAKKREVAGLLRDGQEHKAEIKATSIIMNDYRVEVYTQLIIYLNLLSVRYELLLSQHACPAELKEACCAIVYASPHLSEQTELAVCRVMLLARFGKQFPNQCTDEQAIHPKITTRLSARTPDQTVVNYYVTSIAREFNIDVTPHNGGDGGDDDNDNNNDDGNIFAGGNSGGHVINDAIIPCSHSRVLSPIDPTKGMAYGPGLQDGVAGIPSRFTIDLSQCGSVDSNRERISVLVSGPEETHIFGEVAPNGDGTFAASYVPPLAGAYAVAVYCGERPIGDGKPWVLCVRDAATPADPRMCRAIGSGLLGGVAGVPSTFTIFAHSGDGRECSGGGEAFSVFVSGPGNVRIRGDVVDNNDGTYTATYTPPVPGQYALAVYAGKSPIGNGEPWLFDVSAASSLGPSSSTSTSLPSAELDPAKCYAEGPGLRSPAAGALATFTVMAVGTDGALRSAGGDRFAVLISGPNGARLTGDVCDNGDGTYTATYTPPVAGTYAVAVYANAATMIGNGQPIIVNVNGGGMASKKKGACAEKCTAEGEGLVEGAVGKLACFEIHAIDEDGVPCRTGGEDFSVFVSGPDGSNVQLRGEVLDNDDGTYVVTYTPPVEGLYSIAIMLGTDPIGSGSAYNAMIVGDPSAKKDSGSGEDEEDDLMARFAMLKAGNATEGAAAAGGITGFDSGDVSMELPPSTPSTSSFGNDDDELMAKLNALKGGAPSSLGSETTMRQSGCGNEGSAFGDEDELMAKFNALKDSETPMGQVGGGNSGEEQTLFGDDEDELMAKFNALKGGEVPLSEEHDMGQAAPIEHQTEAAAAAATGSGVSGGIGDGEDDDIMARFNMLKNAESPIDSSSSSSGSVLFPPSSIPSVIVPPPQPQPQKVSTLPDVPISSLFAVRKTRANFGNVSLDGCVVLDNGSGTIKCGIAGMSEPLGFLPTVVGRPLYRSVLPMMDAGRVYVGEEAKKKKGVLSLEYPIEHGMVTNWGDMESVWHHTFYNELRIDPCVRPVVLAEHVLAPHETREKAAEIMFEKFGVPAFFAASQAALALHSLGLTTGLVADVGAGTVQTAAVVRGEVLGYAARRSEYGGRECADLFVSSLAKDGVFLGDTSSERDIARLMMESVGYVAEDYDAEMRRPRADVTVTYTLPDGTVAHPAQARFVCAEPLFRPTLVGKDTLSLPQMAATSILQAPEDARAELARNVVLIGGASLFRGLPERLLRELRAILPKSVAPDKLVLPQERSWAAWLGGSMIGSNVDEYSYLCVTKAEYDESGPLALSFMK